MRASRRSFNNWRTRSPQRSARRPCKLSTLARLRCRGWAQNRLSIFCWWWRISRDEILYLPQLEAIGYELRVREPDFHEHRMFRTPARDVHVHVYSAGSSEIERNLIFRDRLRSNPQDRQRYEDTKRKLATQSWSDMNAYAAAKTQIIEQITATAQAASSTSL